MPVELGLGAAEAVATPGRGRVLGVYTKAAYLRLPGGLMALTTFDVPAGAIHARTSVPLAGLRVGDDVAVTESSLHAGPVTVELTGARTWCGPLPSPDGLAAATPLAVELLTSVPPPALDSPPDAELLQGGDLLALATQLGGRGPGLTPAGDDCLAGILLVAHVRWGATAAEELAAIATSIATNDIALAFLRWAARGQSIEPVHRFLVATAEGDAATARNALGALTRFGHSSGADLATGLRAAVQWLCNAPVQARGQSERGGAAWPSRPSVSRPHVSHQPQPAGAGSQPAHRPITTS